MLLDTFGLISFTKLSTLILWVQSPSDGENFLVKYNSKLNTLAIKNPVCSNMYNWYLAHNFKLSNRNN